MLPLPLLIAIFLAFGLGDRSGGGPLTGAEAWSRAGALGLGVLAVGAASRVLGRALGRSARRRGRPTVGLRRGLVWAGRATDLLALGVFGWGLGWLEWPRLVAWNLRLGRALLIDEVVTLLPFFLAQLLGWWGLYDAERELRPSVANLTRGHYLVLRARQSLGLVVPMALIYGLGRDLLGRYLPQYDDDLRVQLAVIAAMGAIVLAISPAFVRLSWPTRPLPPGVLRDRLERLARRFRFRYTEILVWDTGGTVVNAGVTGALPWFRYVLLSDALIERLDAAQVEAVFGHEVGHVAHRHFFSFGLFFLGSMGVGSLIDLGVHAGLGPGSAAAWVIGDTTALQVSEAAAALSALALYFFLVFGLLSRSFERQADVFGCRAVSCGRADCPPHLDPNATPLTVSPPSGPCPEGIRIFADALAEVAELNGIAPRARSWRHGSIDRRIRFLRSLAGRPESVARFQRGVTRLRLALGLLLVVASGAAFWLWSLARPFA